MILEVLPQLAEAGARPFGAKSLSAPVFFVSTAIFREFNHAFVKIRIPADFRVRCPRMPAGIDARGGVPDAR